MITYVVSDLFQSPARVLVNTVNTVGVMGKGLAKDFKQIYPEMFRQYQELCEKRWLDVGKLWLYKTPNKWVLNFPTKRHWRQPSRPEYIEAGLRKFVDTYHLYSITSISFPLLGCGNGELDWETEVRPIMERYLKKIPVTVFVHLQHRKDPFAPEHHDIRAMQDWLRGEPMSLAFSEVWDDLCSLLKHSADFDCLDMDERFSANISPEAEGIVLGFGGKAVTVPHETLMELWQQIRRSGFVSGESMPSGLDSLARYIVPVMAKLPYVKPVQMAPASGRATKLVTGLRLVPRPQPAESSVFVTAGALELE